MRFIKIELENFRQYKGRKKIEFSLDKEKRFTIIQGPNGSGKTNLLNALTWCLYGQEKHISNSSERISVNLVNKKYLEEVEPNSEIKMWVKLSLVNEKQEQYLIERVLKGCKESDNSITLQKDYVNVMWLQGREWKRIAMMPHYFISRLLLPEDIEGFCFFDGERLDNFFNESDFTIQESIHNVAQITLLSDLLEHLDNVSKEIQKNAKSTNPQIETYKKEMDYHDSEIKRNQDDKEKYSSDYKTIQENINNISEKLKNYPAAKIQELEIKRIDVEQNIDTLENKLNDIKGESLKHLIEIAPFFYCKNAILATIDIINEMYSSGQLPPKIKEPFLRELLESGKCICGNDISQNSPFRKNIEYLIKVKTSDLDDIINNSKFELETIQKLVNEFKSTRNLHGTKISEITDDLDNKSRELKEIKTKIGNIDVEEIQRLDKDREIWHLKKDDAYRNMTLCEANVEWNKNLYNTASLKHKKELTKDETHKLLIKRIEFCENALNVIESIKNEILDEVRTIIETKTSEYFLNLIWKKKTFSKVTINNKYNVEVLDIRGKKAKDDLSAGERQILALSFIASVREAARLNSPVIIDTPLGRISSEPKESIAELLPKYLSDTQTTLLVTDQEYTSLVRNKLDPFIGKEYQLVYNEEDEVTEIESYGK